MIVQQKEAVVSDSTAKEMILQQKQSKHERFTPNRYGRFIIKNV